MFAEILWPEYLTRLDKIREGIKPPRVIYDKDGRVDEKGATERVEGRVCEGREEG